MWSFGHQDSLKPMGLLRDSKTRERIYGLALLTDLKLGQMYLYEKPGKIYRLSIENEKPGDKSHLSKKENYYLIQPILSNSALPLWSWSNKMIGCT